MTLLRVRSIPGFVAGTLVAWLLVSLYVDSFVMRRTPPTLVKWKAAPRWSFMDWLARRNAPIDLFDREK
jgi:hypothetical protein